MECGYDFAVFDRCSNTKSETNVIELNLSCLKQGSNVATGDPVYCPNCKSVLNSFSNLSRTEQNITWRCEFCDNESVLNIDEEEIPAFPELTYVLEAAVQVANSQIMVKSAPAVIFCVDISGSMCVSKPVEGKLNLKTSRLDELKKFINPGEEDQRFVDNVTYVSRLECVQAAIDNQIQLLNTCSPQLKLGLVAFNGDVRVFGDGSHNDLITGDKLFEFDVLKEWAMRRRDIYIEKSVSESCDVLRRKVMELEENGPTALGPALLISIILASAGGPGSKAMICTDGLANVGVGSLEMDTDTDFYDILGNLATELGVSVSIISIEGEECRLESLIKVTKTTGGDVVRVAPEKISEEFSNILSNEVIATNVNVEVSLHKSIEFKNEDPKSLFFMNSKLQKKVGNATLTTSFTFAYNLKQDNELEALGINKASLDTIPIQAIVTYISLEGMKCVRVFNRRQPVTGDRKIAKGSERRDILTRAGRRQAAWYAEQNMYDDVVNCANEWRDELRSSSPRNFVEKEIQEKFESEIQELECIVSNEMQEMRRQADMDCEEVNVIRFEKELIECKSSELQCCSEESKKIEKTENLIIEEPLYEEELKRQEEERKRVYSRYKNSDNYVSKLSKLNKH